VAPALALAALELVAAGCGDSTGKGSNGGTDGNDVPPALADPGQRQGPRVKYHELQVDLGTFTEIESRTARFNFTNDGTERLVIDKVTTDCGCTVATPERWSYGAGESGYVDVVFEPTGPGATTKYVTVVSNGLGAKVQRLAIKADVQSFLEVNPPVVQFDTQPFGVAHTQQIRVKCPDPDVSIERVESTNEHFVPRVLTKDEARAEWGNDAQFAEFVVVTVPETAPWGAHFGQIEITLSAKPKPEAEPVTHTARVRTAVRLYGKLHAKPHSVTFGGHPGERFRRVVRVSRPDGRPFTAEVTATRCEPLLDAQVRLEQVSPSAYDLVVDAQSQSTPEQYKGGVYLRTDVEGEEEIMIPINGITIVIVIVIDVVIVIVIQSRTITMTITREG
jgi:hypothetical protein